MDRETRVQQLADTAASGWHSDPLWFKDAVVYEVHVRAFCDADNDGVGDFAGLTGKLDYIQQLGATCIWLLPFFPSPLKDDGYDVADYQAVHTSYGTLVDFDEFLQAAHARGLRVLIELVLNHTSDQHPWFQAARMAPRGSPQRNFYVWRDDDRGARHQLGGGEQLPARCRRVVHERADCSLLGLDRSNARP